MPHGSPVGRDHRISIFSWRIERRSISKGLDGTKRAGIYFRYRARTRTISGSHWTSDSTGWTSSAICDKKFKFLANRGRGLSAAPFLFRTETDFRRLTVTRDPSSNAANTLGSTILSGVMNDGANEDFQLLGSHLLLLIREFDSHIVQSSPEANTWT